MRKTIAVVSTAGALLFGGTGVANAEFNHAGTPASTTTLAQDDYGNNKDDNSGLWGLAGLLGLLGLLGLRKHNDHHGDRAAGTGRSTAGTHGSGTSLGTSGTSAAAPVTPQAGPGGTPPTV